MAEGLEQGGRGLGRVSKGLGGWGLEGAEGLGSGGRGLDPQGTGRMFVRSDERTEIPPVFFRTSSPLGPLPKKRGFLRVGRNPDALGGSSSVNKPPPRFFFPST